MDLITEIKRAYPGADTRRRNRVYAERLYYAEQVGTSPYRNFADLPEHKKGQWINQAERALA